MFRRRSCGKSVTALVLMGALALSCCGCWGLILHGTASSNPRSDRIDVPVLLLDIFVGFFPIGIIVDAIAGTLHEPSRGWSRAPGGADLTAQYRKLGYQDATKPLVLPEKFRLRLHASDIAAEKSSVVRVVWAGEGASVELYSGGVTGLLEKDVFLPSGHEAGTLDVYVDGEKRLSWQVAGRVGAHS